MTSRKNYWLTQVFKTLRVAIKPTAGDERTLIQGFFISEGKLSRCELTTMQRASAKNR